MQRVELSYYGRDGQARTFGTEAQSLTIGSDPACDLTIEGLAPLETTVYLSAQGYYARDHSGRVAINDAAGAGFLRHNDVLTLGGWLSLRFSVVVDEPAPAPVPGPVAMPRTRRRPGASSATTGTGGHRPGLAAVASFLAPGAGQAYNGQPFKGVAVLLTAPLVIPWILAVLDARAVARRIEATGGRTGRGGFGWIALHLWLMLNVALTVLFGLTVGGVLQ